MRGIKLLILGASIAAGFGAMALVQGQLERARMAAPAPDAEAPQMAKERVLVATGAFKRGHIISAQDFEWRDWPKDLVAEAYVLQSAQPDAVDDLAGAVVRAGFTKGEPIIQSKLITVDHPGALAAMLRPGMRGFAIKVQQETGAGGFIAPGNYVDIILTRRIEPQRSSVDHGVSQNVIIRADTLVRTVRVLAVDEELDDEGERHFDMKRTLTLEVTPAQAELLSFAEEAGRVTVALRSIAELVDADGKLIDEPMPTLAIDLADLIKPADAEWPATEQQSFSLAELAALFAKSAAPHDAQAASKSKANPQRGVTILRYTTMSRVPVADAPGADKR